MNKRVPDGRRDILDDGKVPVDNHGGERLDGENVHPVDVNRLPDARRHKAKVSVADRRVNHHVDDEQVFE